MTVEGDAEEAEYNDLFDDKESEEAIKPEEELK